MAGVLSEKRLASENRSVLHSLFMKAWKGILVDVSGVICQAE